MSACCSESNVSSSEKSAEVAKFIMCPQCENKCAAVPYQTVLLHILTPWLAELSEQPYYFCRSNDCDTVYVGADKSAITTLQMRTKVGIKDTVNDALVCYCFGVSKAEAVSNTSVKAFVVEQTKKGVCICSTHNPSGKCCLKDFPS